MSKSGNGNESRLQSATTSSDPSDYNKYARIVRVNKNKRAEQQLQQQKYTQQLF